MNIPILIVEDESIVAMEIESYISQLGYNVVATATNSEDAIRFAKEFEPHVILMDINIKGDYDGIETAQSILSRQHTTIIYITAFNDDATIERAVNTDPAAYLSKPFNRQELNASIKIALMHYHKATFSAHTQRGDVILNEEFSYNSKDNQLMCCSEYVHLTKREQELLKLLIRSRNAIVSIYEMENTIWPEKMPIESTRRALISRLRSKLKHQFIDTIPAIGYRINF